jgi:hypothetical protein
MAQDTDLTLPPDAAATPTNAVPVFGRRADAFEDRHYRRFGLEVEGKRPGDREESRWVEEFDCFTDVDGGMWVSMGNARTPLEVAQATVRFMGTNLPDDPDSDWLRGEPSEVHPDGEPLYLGWDGVLYVKADYPPMDDLADGSSRRRFAVISDSMHMRYRLEALQELSDWLTQAVTGRPTKRPLPSGHGPQRTGRGSSGKRR